MSRLRSVLVVALIWAAAFAGSSASVSPGGATSRGSDNGKRWAATQTPASGLWDLPNIGNGKRWD
jgi:hypothetical protein